MVFQAFAKVVPVMKVALTGGSGFLGRALYRALLKQEHEPVLLLRQHAAFENFNCSVRQVDFRQLSQMKNVLQGCEILLHTIGLTNGTEEDLWESNAFLTERLMQALPDSIRRVVYVSSAAAAMLKGSYGKSKKKAEEFVQASGREWMIARPTLIVGPDDTKNLQMMLDWVEKRLVVPVLGGGHFKVQPVFIDDVVSALLRMVETEKRDHCYLLCGPEQVSLRRMLEVLRERSNSFCLFVPVPLKPIQKALKFWSRIFPNTRLPVKQVMELDKHEAFDFKEAAKDLGFSPRSFEEALEWLS
jgi:NADH dehydrogenase